MAEQLGRAITYVYDSPNVGLLTAMFNWFTAGSDPNWQIKAGVTLPNANGSQGFVLEDVATGGINVAFGDHATVGGVMMNSGAALGSGDYLVAGIDPGGAITNITPGGFTVGPRWSGWGSNAAGGSSQSGRAKLSSGADWLFLRVKSTTGVYPGGCFLGRYSRLDAGIGDGFCLLAGAYIYWSDRGADAAGVESFEGSWVEVLLSPDESAGGTIGDSASDGAGAFRTTPVAVFSDNGTYANSAVIGTLPCMFSASQGAVAKQWFDGSTVIGYNMSGGAWIARDDGTDAE